MKKILAFCFFPAFTPVSNGGQSRLFNFYKSLSRWHRVTLLTSTHSGVDEEVISHTANFIERRIPKDQYFSYMWAELMPYSSGGDLSGPCIAACGKYPTLLHQAYLEEYAETDIIIHDFPFTVGYDLFFGIDNKLRVYNAHNCETVLYQTLHPSEQSKSIHELVQSTEMKALEGADLVLYCNESDLGIFRELAPDSDFVGCYAPNGMNPTDGQAKKMDKLGMVSAVFVGSAHPPNVKAALRIAREIAPLVPDVRFDFIGTCLPEGKYAANVVRHGVVTGEEKTRLLGNATLALNPMDSGSGSNVKVLDYFAHAAPVLSTSFGMRGIHAEAGRHYLEASLEDFPVVIRSLLDKCDELTKIGRAGKAYANENYSWDIIAGSVASVLVEQTEKKAQCHKRLVIALNDYDSFTCVGGGGTRTRGLYAAVSAWAPVFFICFSSNGEIALRQHNDNIFVLTVPKTQEHIAEQNHGNAQFHISVDDIVAIRHCLSNPFLLAIYRAARDMARIIVVEHPYMAPVPIAFGDRFIYSSQNNEAELKKRLLEWHPFKESLVADVAKIEQQAVELSAAVVAVSEEDAYGLVKGKKTAGSVIVVRNGAEEPEAPREIDWLHVQTEVGPRSAVFLGSAHMPNVEAAHYILDFIAPACPDVEFHFIGSVCDPVASKAQRNVRFWGILDGGMKSAVMQACGIAINPMLSGSGSNVKLADYLANGLYVVTTVFGQRGYPEGIRDEITISLPEEFAAAIKSSLNDSELLSESRRERRKTFFRQNLSMKALAKGFLDLLKAQELPKKKVLFVTYRYTHPLLGGAEAFAEHCIRALAMSGEFTIDLVAPEVSGIHNVGRFAEYYDFDRESSAPINIPNMRFARFPLDDQPPARQKELLRNAWLAQPVFEWEVCKKAPQHLQSTGLAWGWADLEGSGRDSVRWALTSCGVFLASGGSMVIKGYAPDEVVISIKESDGRQLSDQSVKGNFELTSSVRPGMLEIHTTARLNATVDPRPLAFLLRGLYLDDNPIDFSAPTLFNRIKEAAENAFELLADAADSTRSQLDIRLTDIRGPWSASLENYISRYVGEYDLVVTHNNVFRPAIAAIDSANKHGVPVILIPHAHLDDDYYHFPDLLESALNADLVLAVPKAACDFYEKRGCNVAYLPAGAEIDESFGQTDIKAFHAIYHSETPFVLVLGRKSGAKGYPDVIEAVERLNFNGTSLHVVLIGPDDDGKPIESRHATYLGRLPREAVRGALMSCIALVNMSSSESFGMVLLEAWLAGKPVIVNKGCAAFHDMAIDGENALLVDRTTLDTAILKILQEPEFARSLAVNGRKLVDRFDWARVEHEFVNHCRILMDLEPAHDGSSD